VLAHDREEERSRELVVLVVGVRSVFRDRLDAERVDEGHEAFALALNVLLVEVGFKQPPHAPACEEVGEEVQLEDCDAQLEDPVREPDPKPLQDPCRDCRGKGMSVRLR